MKIKNNIFVKKIMQIIGCITIAFGSICMFACKNNDAPPPTFICDPEIAKHDENAWINTINELADTKIPTIYITQDASFQILEQTLMYFAIDGLARQRNHCLPNAEYKFADRISIVPFSVYHYKTKSQTSLFKYDYYQYVNKSNILVDGFENANNMLITHLEDFDTSTSDYSSEDGSIQSNDYVNTYKALDKIFSIYDQLTNKKTKFNFVISDLLPVNHFEWNNWDDFMARILNRANKIYTLSDGSYSYGWHITDYKNLYQKYGYIDSNKQAEIWEQCHNTSDYEIVKQIFNSNPIALLNNERYYVNFALDGNFWKSYINVDSSINLYPETQCKYAEVQLNWTIYDSIFNMNEETYNNFSNLVNTFFTYQVGDKFDKFVDYGTYDKNKKNLILTIPIYTLTRSEVRDQNIRDIFKKLNEKFPIDQYNYIYKFHPRATQEESSEAIKHIFDGQIPTNTIILKNTYPIEYLVLLDQDLVKNKIESFYHMVDIQSYLNPLNEVNGIMGGFDFITTSLMSIMSIIANYQNSNGYIVGYKNALKLLESKAFYIPSRFSHINGVETEDGYNEGIKWLKTYYEQFYSVGEFISCYSFDKC